MTMDLNTVDNPEAILDHIIRDLDAATTKLPEEAIRNARKHYDRIIPRLIQAIQVATVRAASGDVPEGKAHFFALFLLTEFGAKESLPAILEAISLPGELPFDLFGDAVTEILPRVFAALACDAPELLDALIGNRSLNEYVRAAAADTYLFFVRDGRLTRDEAVERLRDHLRDAISNGDSDVAEFLVNALLDLSALEAMNEIREAFRLELVDELMVDITDVDRSLSAGDSEFQKRLEFCRPTGIQDTVDELKGWHTFADDPELTSAIHDKSWEADPGTGNVPRWHGTIRNTQPRVGRNDPCPCGSGKKFKKCCGQNKSAK